MRLHTFEERYNYLRLSGDVGRDTFGFDRYINQRLYHSSLEWKRARELVIIRDNACDLGMADHPITTERIIIHHMNPITLEDIENGSGTLFNPEYLITTIQRTHNAIHYGDQSLLRTGPIERKPGDTCPWK